MKTLSLTLTGLLLATTALAAPSLVYAQTAGGQAGAGATQSGTASPGGAGQSTGGLPAANAPAGDPGATDSAPQSPTEPAASEPEPQDTGPTEVGEIVVLGRNIPEPLRETSEVVSVLTTEDLERQGDDTAASALTRVAGLSLVQGRFVYVRGLGERYSSALLNGSPLPSPEPLQRVVPLDLFPASILASTNVQKTYSPDLPGEFGGGVIDLRTVGVPDEPFLSLGISTGGDTETTFEPGITYYGSDSDWTGYDDDTRQTPGELGAALARGQLIGRGAFTNEELQRIGRDFVNAPITLIQRTDDVQPDFGLDLSGGTNFDLGWGNLGVIAVFGYDNSWQTRTGEQESDGNINAGRLEARNDYDFTSTQNDVVVNGLFGLGLEWGENRIDWTNLYVHSTTKEARVVAGFSDQANRELRTDFTEWFERSLINTQLAGSHQFQLETGDLEIDWRAAYAKTTRDAPYERFIRYENNPQFGFAYTGGSFSDNQTSFSEVEDEVTSGGIDFQYTLPLSGVRDAVFSAGYAYLDNERQAERRSFRFNNVRPLTLPEQFQRVDYLFSDFNLRPDFFEIQEVSQGDAPKYEGQLKVNAFYGQVDAEIVPLVRVAAGLRYEDGEQTLNPLSITNQTIAGAAQIEEQYVLPAATLTWNFYEDMQLRLGASRTIARPQFRELAPQQFLDPESDRIFVGNPFLTDSELLNLDARYEWFFRTGEYVTVGVFYKDIDKPIESLVQPGGATLIQTFLNAPSATLYGLELDGRITFDLPEQYQFLSGDAQLFLAANYTYSKSEVQAEEGDTVRLLSGGGAPRPASDLVENGSRLQGQSEHLANIQIGIQDEDAGTQATFLLNYVSDRISARGIRGVSGVVQPDFIQDPGVTLDFVLRQGFEVYGRELTFGFEARNLTGEDFEEYQEFGGGRVNLNTYDLGTSLSVSLSARF